MGRKKPVPPAPGKPYTGGHADRQRRGVRGVLIPLTPRQHALVTLAAGQQNGPARAVSRWSAARLEAVAIQELTEAGIDYEKKIEEST